MNVRVVSLVRAAFLGSLIAGLSAEAQNGPPQQQQQPQQQQRPQTRPAQGGHAGGQQPGNRPGGQPNGGTHAGQPGGAAHPAQGNRPAGQPQGNRPGGQPAQGANRPSQGGNVQRPPQQANRPGGVRPGQRPPQYGRPPASRPTYNFRPADRSYLRNYYASRLRLINRARRPAFRIGMYFPLAYIGYLQPVPPSMWGMLPPIPPGYQVGYYDGYVVVYDPVTYWIVGVIDLM